MSRAAEVLGKVPLVTLGIIGLCLLLQVWQFLLEPDVYDFALSARGVLFYREYYRIVSSALLHGGLMHIGFNMMAVHNIGAQLEAAMGSIAFLLFVLWSMLLGGWVYVTQEYIMTVFITGNPKYLNQPAVGFSGVIFTLAVVEAWGSSQPTRSLYGVVSVPTKVFPFALLCLISIMMPTASFAGHLGGLFVGLLHVYGVTRPLLPSNAYCRGLEDSRALSCVVSKAGFKPTPTPLPTLDGSGGLRELSLVDALHSLTWTAKWLAVSVWWAVATVLHIVGINTGGTSGSARAGVELT